MAKEKGGVGKIVGLGTEREEVGKEDWIGL